MHCGQPLMAPQAPVAMPRGPLGPAAMPMNMSSAFDAQRRRNAMIAGGIGTAALVAAVLIGASATGLLKIGAHLPTTDATAKKLNIGPPVLAKVAQSQGMPKDVEDWLKHLEETERRKIILTKRQYTELSAMPAMMQLGVTTPEDVQELTDPDKVLDKTPDNEALQKTVSDLRPAWYRLNDFFLSMPAPSECKTIEANYSEGLSQVGDTMGDIAKIVDSVNPMSADLNNDVKKGKQDVYEIQQTHRETIDEAFKKTLFGVDEVCKKYGRTRWFDIDTSGGGSDILGKFMGG
jgi:hypothetical protein